MNMLWLDNKKKDNFRGILSGKKKHFQLQLH